MASPELLSELQVLLSDAVNAVAADPRATSNPQGALIQVLLGSYKGAGLSNLRIGAGHLPEPYISVVAENDLTEAAARLPVSALTSQRKADVERCLEQLLQNAKGIQLLTPVAVDDAVCTAVASSSSSSAAAAVPTQLAFASSVASLRLANKTRKGRISDSLLRAVNALNATPAESAGASENAAEYTMRAATGAAGEGEGAVPQVAYTLSYGGSRVAGAGSVLARVAALCADLPDTACASSASEATVIDGFEVTPPALTASLLTARSMSGVAASLKATAALAERQFAEYQSAEATVSALSRYASGAVSAIPAAAVMQAVPAPELRADTAAAVFSSRVGRGRRGCMSDVINAVATEAGKATVTSATSSSDADAASSAGAPLRCSLVLDLAARQLAVLPSVVAQLQKERALEQAAQQAKEEAEAAQRRQEAEAAAAAAAATKGAKAPAATKAAAAAALKPNKLDKTKETELAAAQAVLCSMGSCSVASWEQQAFPGQYLQQPAAGNTAAADNAAKGNAAPAAGSPTAMPEASSTSSSAAACVADEQLEASAVVYDVQPSSSHLNQIYAIRHFQGTSADHTDPHYQHTPLVHTLLSSATWVDALLNMCEYYNGTATLPPTTAPVTAAAVPAAGGAAKPAATKPALGAKPGAAAAPAASAPPTAAAAATSAPVSSLLDPLHPYDVSGWRALRGRLDMRNTAAVAAGTPAVTAGTSAITEAVLALLGCSSCVSSAAGSPAAASLERQSSFSSMASASATGKSMKRVRMQQARHAAVFAQLRPLALRAADIRKATRAAAAGGSDQSAFPSWDAAALANRENDAIGAALATLPHVLACADSSVVHLDDVPTVTSLLLVLQLSKLAGLPLVVTAHSAVTSGDGLLLAEIAKAFQVEQVILPSPAHTAVPALLEAICS